MSQPSTTTPVSRPFPRDNAVALATANPSLAWIVGHRYKSVPEVIRRDGIRVANVPHAGVRLIGQRRASTAPTRDIRELRIPVADDGWPLDLHEYELAGHSPTPTTGKAA